MIIEYPTIVSRYIRYDNTKIHRIFKLIKIYDNFALYEEKNYHFKECFSAFELQLLRQEVKPGKKW